MNKKDSGNPFLFFLLVLVAVVVLWLLIPDSWMSSGILLKVNQSLGSSISGITGSINDIGSGISNAFKGFTR